MEYKFTEIEEKCKKYWDENATYKVVEDAAKPKYYVLDMFPYPSGAGLHVGHPLGYVASDIYARYKRLKGYNVLHPMGYDAFGLPAEQYAIETGTHPAVTTDTAITRYRQQMDKIGFSFDWSREVKTCDPDYYKWTQWIFLKLFNSWYNREKNRAEPIETLIQGFETYGCTTGWKQFDPTLHPTFTAYDWRAFSKKQKERILQFYRLAYRSYTEVNWCEALGCVLANDEVKDGKSERGGYPVTRKRMRQWSLRITEYADRLLQGLDTIDWSDSLKDQQRNWIGRSEGALIQFKVLNITQTLPGNTVLSPTLSEGEGAGTPKFMTGDREMSKTTFPYAKHNRRNPTEAEEKLWAELRREQLGYKFRRQHLIDAYIADFVCLKKGLVVELDGEIHKTQTEEDQQRTNRLGEYGFTVIRFYNNEVLKNTSSVINQIKAKLDSLPDRPEQDQSLSEGDGSNSPLLRRGAGGEDSTKDFVEGGNEAFELDTVLEVFTTRPDTLFGATFLVVAPEHEYIDQLITADKREEMAAYLAYVKSRSDVERQQEKKVTGCFTGSYAVHPFTGRQVPIWTAEYVLAGYGTGAIMAVPADDERDRKFAEKFGLEIVEVIDKSMYPGATIEDKVGKMINSDFLDGMEVEEAIAEMIKRVESMGIGKGQVNYKLRDASYSRQRYWGEPFPIKYEVQGDVDSPFVDESDTDEADIPVALDESELPLVLPAVESYKPGGDGRSPLANNAEWVARNLETDTMPGYAGSSWYYLRYMDPKNPNAFADKTKVDYWQNVDVYFGGSEHAVGHLLYSRFWHKVLFDLGYVPTDEPFKKLVNQGMIQGVSAFAYRLTKKNVFVSANSPRYESDNEYINSDDLAQMMWKDFLKKKGIDDSDPSPTIAYDEVRVSVECLDKDGYLDIEKFKKWRPEYSNSHFYPEEKFECFRVVEKMSKSKYNVVNPDDVIAQYGADCFRMFEMFLGPIEQSKPWDDKGISGVSNFLKKFWRLFYDDKGWKVTDEAATDAELKILHKTIKKIADDIERLNLNTCVSAFMIATNELTSLKCSKRAVLQPLLITLAPFAPFITEELWSKLGNTGSIHQAAYPVFEEKYLTESEFDYPVSINGKVRAQVKLGLDVSAEEAQAHILGLEAVLKWTNGAPLKKFVFVKGRIINVVV
jgi:leucyl-tRNA synthetase